MGAPLRRGSFVTEVAKRLPGHSLDRPDLVRDQWGSAFMIGMALKVVKRR
jgi:hypothetical protein